jgi:hypothetical protein
MSHVNYLRSHLLVTCVLNTGQWRQPDPRRLPGIATFLDVLCQAPSANCLELAPGTLWASKGGDYDLLRFKHGELRANALMSIFPEDSAECWRLCRLIQAEFKLENGIRGFHIPPEPLPPVPWLAAWFDPAAFRRASPEEIQAAMDTLGAGGFALLGYDGQPEEASPPNDVALEQFWHEVARIPQEPNP